MKEKEVIIDYRATKEYKRFYRKVQLKFRKYFRVLELEGRLEEPEGKRLNSKLCEARVKMEGAYRGFYSEIKNNRIVFLRFFIKKSNKTPKKEIEIAMNRLRDYI
jgi:phage-related protein